jgi:hypothetical protein
VLPGAKKEPIVFKKGTFFNSVFAKRFNKFHTRHKLHSLLVLLRRQTNNSQRMKNLFLLIPVFIWLQACSQSPSADAAKQGASQGPLPDSSSILGDSPDHAYRLFKSTRTVDGQTLTDLKVLRLNDLQQFLVSTIPNDSKYFWSPDSRYLIAENIVADSAMQRETVFFDLGSLSTVYKKTGALIAFDAANQVVFFYFPEEGRQIISFTYLHNPTVDKRRDITAPGIGKLPSIILMTKEKQARVKAFTTDDVPVNLMVEY